MDNNKQNKELAVFWAQSQPKIASYIFAQVPNFQDADDILQNVAVVTVDKFEKFDRSGSFTAWAIGIAKVLILKYYNEKRKARLMLDSDAIQIIAEVCETEQKKINDQKEVFEKHLKACMLLLKAKWKKMLDMHYKYEFSPDRIAQQLSMTTNNVYVSLHRIRLSLKECVEKKISGSRS